MNYGIVQPRPAEPKDESFFRSLGRAALGGLFTAAGTVGGGIAGTAIAGPGPGTVAGAATGAAAGGTLGSAVGGPVANAAVPSGAQAPAQQAPQVAYTGAEDRMAALQKLMAGRGMVPNA